jgi:addiction module HigA family antidote
MINTIVNGKARITTAMAAKLGATLGTSPEYWLNAQMLTDLWELKESGIELPGPISIAS